jgi:hypothetical protein
MDLSTIGKWIIFSGLAIAGLGMLVWFLGKTGLPLGRLPGDLSIERPGFSFHFPIVTAIIISIVLTVVLNLLIRLFHK